MIRGVVCGIGAAFLLVGAQHVHGGLAWLLGVPFALAAREARHLAVAMTLAVTFTLLAAVLGEMPWVAATGIGYFGLPSSVAWPAAATVVVVHGLMVGPVLGAGFHAAARYGAARFVVCGVAAWVVWEELLLWWVPYYPWVSLAATQLESPMLVQAVAWVGQRGLAAVVLATGLTLGLAWRERRIAPALVALGLPVALGIAGSIRLAVVAARPPAGCTVSSLDAGITAPPPAPEEVWQRYATATLAAAEETAEADVLVWPESALPVDPTTNFEARRSLDELVRERGAPLLAGGRRVVWGEDWQSRIFNSVFLLRPGAVAESYDKRRLVPLAEYWPAPAVLRPSAWPIAETTPGDSDVVWRIGDCRLGVSICFESDDPWRAATLRRRGARALVMLTNDAQLPAAVAAAETRQARLRALETGLPVLRAANRGGSVVVDPYGRIRATSDGGWMSMRFDEPRVATAIWIAPWIVGLAAVVTGAAIGSALRPLTRKGGNGRGSNPPENVVG